MSERLAAQLAAMRAQADSVLDIKWTVDGELLRNRMSVDVHDYAGLLAVAEAAAAFVAAEEYQAALEQSRCPDDHEDDVQMAAASATADRYEALCAALEALAGEAGG